MMSGNAFRVIAYVILGIAVLVRLLSRRQAVPHLLLWSVLWIYLLESLRLTLFPIPVDGIMASAIGDENVFAQIELNPLEGMTARQVIGNVLLGFPFGLGTWFVIGRPSTAKVLRMGFYWFLLIELNQLAVSYAVGFTYRVTDLADLLLNVFGVLIGATAFKALTLLPDSVLGDGEGSALWAYIADVLRSSRLSRGQRRMEPAPSVSKATDRIDS